ncbi:hypothetical protein BASA83_002719 [Batrachochytrium salamandrivorans]|nr:hypothetical protein BASA83_002719 [Batrachochytrium salamandrivorans]
MRPAYQQEIQQMMYVFGELSEPNDETLLLVEEIVRNQMIETIIQAVQQATKRGSKFVNRLRTFLSWKDVRKNVKDNKEGPPVEEEVADDQDKTAKVRKMKVKFSWDYLNTYTNILSDDDDDEADDEDRQAYEDQAARLRLADNITTTMTKDEYMYYSDCRQASFTFKKVKRFREWCEMAKHYENKAPSDVLDIMGFLAYEIVSKITETGLAIKKSGTAKKNWRNCDQIVGWQVWMCFCLTSRVMLEHLFNRSIYKRPLEVYRHHRCLSAILEGKYDADVYL